MNVTYFDKVQDDAHSADAADERDNNDSHNEVRVVRVSLTDRHLAQCRPAVPLHGQMQNKW